MYDLDPGSVRHTVLVYAISEPGQWTTQTIAEDLPGSSVNELEKALTALTEKGYLHVNSFDRRLWPLRAGRQAIAAAV